MKRFAESSNSPVVPVPADVHRPRWSVMIPTYKSSIHLRTTLESVLAQALPAREMQIEVIDDGSPGEGAREFVAEIAGDRVGFFRKPANAGLVANFNTCIERARGEYVHILHDDDAVLPGFYRTMESVMTKDEALGAAFCRFVAIDGQDRWLYVSPMLFPTSRALDNPAVQLARRNFLRTPSVVVRRAAYERIGGFDPRLSHTADWEMWVRIAANYGVWYEDRPLALYREHAGSDTSNLARSGENLRQICKASDLFCEYLPPSIRAGCRGLSHAWAAIIGWQTSKSFLRQGDWKVAARVLIAAARCLPRPDEAVRGYLLEREVRGAARAEAERETDASL